MDSISKIYPPKFIRYLFFIAYCWYRRFSSERSDAHFTAILFLSVGHLCLLLAIFLNLNYLLGDFDIWFAFIFSSLISYIFFWNNDKWKNYLQEFSYINRKSQKIGLIYLFIYLFVCLTIAIKSYDISEVFRKLF